MTNKIGLENFRIFKELTEFELKPLTILTGANSSGKSSLIKSLLLLKNSAFKSSNLNKLEFIGGKHLLGSFQNTINDESEIQTISFSFDMVLKYFDTPATIKLTYLPDSKLSENGVLKKLEICHLGNIILSYVKLEDYKDHLSDDQNNQIESDFRYKLGDLSTSYKVNFKYLLNNLSSINQKNTDQNHQKEINKLLDPNFKIDLSSLIKSDQIRMRSEARFEVNESIIWGNSIFNSFNRKISISYDEKKKISKINVNEKLIHSSHLLDKLGDKFDSVYEKVLNTYLKNNGLYLTSTEDNLYECLKNNLRHPLLLPLSMLKRSNLEANIDDLDDSRLTALGDFLINDILISSLDDFFASTNNYLSESVHFSSVRAHSERLYHSNSDVTNINTLILTFLELGIFNDKEIISFINRYLNVFEIGDELIFERHQAVATEIYIKKGRKKMLLADLGFGFTQLIPILLGIGIAASKNRIDNSEFDVADDFKGSLFLLEEPESNLHPSLQSKLAELLVEASTLYNIQFIVETHSEYIIRKLQNLIATKTTQLTKNGLAVYYFYNPRKIPIGEQQVYRLDIREDGFMNNDFGKGFFDESSTLTLGLLNNSNFN